MTVLDCYWDRRSNKTHVRIDAGQFIEWYWIAGEVRSHADVLAWLEPAITKRLSEFNAGQVDTPHEIEVRNAGLL